MAARRLRGKEWRPECQDRDLCLGAKSKQLYNLQFKDVKKLDAGGPITENALSGGDIDVGLLFTGSTGSPIPLEPTTGAIVAMDPANGSIKWKFDLMSPAPSGLVSTAGGLVFAGTREGHFIALDATTGKVLWKYQTGATIIAPPISYSFNGRQYLAVESGSTMMTFSLPEWETR